MHIPRLLLCLTVLSLVSLASAATIHYSATDSTTEVRSVFSDKTLFLNSADVAERLHVTLRPDTAAGVLVLCTPHNCVPAYPGDSAEVRSRDGVLYVRSDEVAAALGCQAQVKKKRDIYLDCPAGLPSAPVGSAAGDRAPGFRLKPDTVSVVALEDLLQRGPVLMVFIRNGEWDPFSKLLLRLIQSNLDSIRQMGYQPVAVHGYDAKLSAKWTKDLALHYPLLADEFGAVLRAYELFDRGRLAIPGLVAIDRSGTIRLRHLFDLNSPPDLAPILEQLRRAPR